MSDSAGIEAEVRTALTAYDRSHDVDNLRDAADLLIQIDGAPPDDPAEAAMWGHAEVALWMEIFGRIGRDLDPAFNPDEPPPTRVEPPVINGAQMLAGTKPSDIKDPALRKQFEDAIAANQRRIENFGWMYNLSTARPALIERATESLRTVRDTLGVAATDIAATIDGAALLDADKAALLAALEQ